MSKKLDDIEAEIAQAKTKLNLAEASIPYDRNYVISLQADLTALRMEKNILLQARHSSASAGAPSLWYFIPSLFLPFNYLCFPLINQFLVVPNLFISDKAKKGGNFCEMYIFLWFFNLGVLDRWSASSFGALILSGVLWGGACLCIHYGVSETILDEYGKLCLQLSSPLWDLLKQIGEAIAEEFVDLYRQWAGIE